MEEKKKKWGVEEMAEVAIFAALGYVLDMLAGLYSAPLFPNGGSIGLAMVCVYIMAYRRGLLAGIITGLVIGLLDLADGFYVIGGQAWYIAFIQVALDYWIAYPLVGFAGLFTKKIQKSSTKGQLILWSILGVLLGGLLKYAAHVLSGALFWGSDSSSFAWSFQGTDISAWPYSSIYNIAYMGPSIVLSGIVTCLLVSIWPKMVYNENIRRSIKREKNE